MVSSLGPVFLSPLQYVVVVIDCPIPDIRMLWCIHEDYGEGTLEVNRSPLVGFSTSQGTGVLLPCVEAYLLNYYMSNICIYLLQDSMMYRCMYMHV